MMIKLNKNPLTTETYYVYKNQFNKTNQTWNYGLYKIRASVIKDHHKITMMLITIIDKGKYEKLMGNDIEGKDTSQRCLGMVKELKTINQKSDLLKTIKPQGL